MLTTFDLDEYVYEALRAGAGGFMLKDAPPRQLAEAVRTVAVGDSLLAPAVTRRLVERYVRRPPPDAAARETFGELTDGSWRSSSSWRRAVQRGDRRAPLPLGGDGEDPPHAHPPQLGLRDRVQAVVLAYESGLVEPGASADGSPGRQRGIDSAAA